MSGVSKGSYWKTELEYWINFQKHWILLNWQAKKPSLLNIFQILQLFEYLVFSQFSKDFSSVIQCASFDTSHDNIYLITLSYKIYCRGFKALKSDYYKIYTNTKKKIIFTTDPRLSNVNRNGTLKIGLFQERCAENWIFV